MKKEIEVNGFVYKLFNWLSGVEVDVHTVTHSFILAVLATIPIGTYLRLVFDVPVIFFSIFIIAAFCLDMIMGIRLNVMIKGEPLSKVKMRKWLIDLLLILSVTIVFKLFTVGFTSFEDKYPEMLAKVIDGGASAAFILLMSVIGYSLLLDISVKGAEMGLTAFKVLAKVIGAKIKKLEDE